MNEIEEAQIAARKNFQEALDRVVSAIPCTREREFFDERNNLLAPPSSVKHIAEADIEEALNQLSLKDRACGYFAARMLDSALERVNTAHHYGRMALNTLQAMFSLPDLVDVSRHLLEATQRTVIADSEPAALPPVIQLFGEATPEPWEGGDESNEVTVSAIPQQIERSRPVGPVGISGTLPGDTVRFIGAATEPPPRATTATAIERPVDQTARTRWGIVGLACAAVIVVGLGLGWLMQEGEPQARAFNVNRRVENDAGVRVILERGERVGSRATVRVVVDNGSDRPFSPKIPPGQGRMEGLVDQVAPGHVEVGRWILQDDAANGIDAVDFGDGLQIKELRFE